MKDSTNPITYDKQSAPTHKICHKNFVETDIRGFGTKVGTYSNYSTIIEAMRPFFRRHDQAAQQEELLLRKKLLREINGQEIDRIKGVEAKGPPKDEWLKRLKIDPEDTDEVKMEKYYHNSLVIDKKPYFFRYLYSELNESYRDHEQKYDMASKALFKMPLKKLLAKENKTKREKFLIRNYKRFMPVIMSDCTMNNLCRKIENANFKIQYNKDCVNMLPHYDINEYKIDPEMLAKFRKLYQKFCNKKAVSVAKRFFDEDDEDYDSIIFGIIDSVLDEICTEYETYGLTTMEGLTYIYALSQSYVKFNWDFAWSMLGESIISCIEEKEALAPIEDENGEDFLGRKFSLLPISREEQEYLVSGEFEEEQ